MARGFLAMKVVRAYKYKLKPSKSVIAKFEHWLSICRELYNAGLQERRDAWKLERKNISYCEQSKQLPQIKEIREDVSEVYSQVLQNVLKSLDRNFQAFFKRIENGEKAGYPRFKNENRFNSFTYPQMRRVFKLVGNKLTIAKIGSVRLHLSREIVGEIKTCTIKRESSGWFVIFVIESDSDTLPKTNKQIGIDVGIENFLTLSDGTQIKNSRFFEQLQKKIRVAQRRVSRRRKNSNRRRKAVIQLKKLYAKVRNSRNDFQHKISRSLINEFDLIAIENLNVEAMSRSLFAKQLNDVAWGNFFQKLLYKAESAGRKVVKVNPNGTSQTCICGQRVEKTLSIRWHQCSNCGLSCHRDIVSAQIILNRAVGQTVKALNNSKELFALESLLNT
jgi:putative transposase